MRLLVMAFLASVCMSITGCASELQSSPNSVDRARAQMLESGRRAQLEGVPTKMLDGETATAAMRQYRAQPAPQSNPALPASLIDALQGSSQ